MGQKYGEGEDNLDWWERGMQATKCGTYITIPGFVNEIST